MDHVVCVKEKVAQRIKPFFTYQRRWCKKLMRFDGIS